MWFAIVLKIPSKPHVLQSIDHKLKLKVVLCFKCVCVCSVYLGGAVWLSGCALCVIVVNDDTSGSFVSLRLCTHTEPDFFVGPQR